MRSLGELLFLSWNSANKIWRKWSSDGRQHCASPAWRDLYIAALFETNNERMAERIVEAKQGLVLRARELFKTAGDHMEEEMAIDDTVQALHALERCRLHMYSSVQPDVNSRALMRQQWGRIDGETCISPFHRSALRDALDTAKTGHFYQDPDKPPVREKRNHFSDCR